MLKNWLTIGSIAFGVSFVCALPFNQNLGRSALVGLATIPGAIAATTVKSRQRQRQNHRQLTAETARLQGLRQQSAKIDRQLQSAIADRQSIEARVHQLTTLVSTLSDRIARDRQYQSQLEQHLAITTIHCEEQEVIAAKLDLQISDKRADLLEAVGQLSEVRLQLDTTESDLNLTQAKIADLGACLLTKTHEIASSDRVLQLASNELIARETELTNLQSQIHTHQDRVDDRELVDLKLQLSSLDADYQAKQLQLIDLDSQLAAKTIEIATSDCSLQTTKQEISAHQSELASLETRVQLKLEEVNQIDLISLRANLEAIESEHRHKQTQLAELEIQLAAKTAEIATSDRNLQFMESELVARQAELTNLESQLQAKIDEANQIDLVALRAQLNTIELQSRDKQGRLAELEAQLVTKTNEIAASDRSRELTQLELIDRRSELAELEAKIYAKLEEMDDVERDLSIAMQRLAPQPPQVSRSIDALLTNGAWHQNFIDNPHLEILQHIEKHGAIAEAEVNHKLGNPRSVRQFANKLEEYTQQLPFAIRVESSPQGNRYLRDSHN